MQTEYEKVLMNNRGTMQPKNTIAMVPATQKITLN